MPHISRKPSPNQSAPLNKVLKTYLVDEGISVRKAAAQMGIGASHLSHILNGEKSPDAGVCNAIADFMGVQRVQVLGLAGWLDLTEIDDAEITKIILSVAGAPEQAEELKRVFYNIGDSMARENFLKWLQHSDASKKL